jgi:amino acid permease
MLNVRLTTLMTFTMVLLLAVFSTVVFAQDGSIGDLELISGLLTLVKESKGASTFVILGTVIQAFILFSRHRWSDFLGKYKLILVMLMSFVGIFITGKIQGLEFFQILKDSATLTAFQVLIHQLYKQFGPKSNE